MYTNILFKAHTCQYDVDIHEWQSKKHHLEFMYLIE